MTAIDDIRFHHVANGTSTTDLLARAGVPGTRSIWADPLHEGPVPAGLSDRELMAVRAATSPTATERRRRRSPPSSLAGARRSTTPGAYDELVLWYEHDLFDQLNLIQVLDRIRATAAPARAVTLICIGAFPGRPDFKGLGELSPAEIGPLLRRARR